MKNQTPHQCLCPPRTRTMRTPFLWGSMQQGLLTNGVWNSNGEWVAQMKTGSQTGDRGQSVFHFFHLGITGLRSAPRIAMEHGRPRWNMRLSFSLRFGNDGG